MSQFPIQRAEPRYEVNARVELGGADPEYHRVQNISLGGIGLVSPNIQEVGTLVELVIHFPDLDGASIAVKGKVVWANRDPPTDMGISFLDLDEGKREMLREYLRRVVIAVARTGSARTGG